MPVRPQESETESEDDEENGNGGPLEAPLNEAPLTEAPLNEAPLVRLLLCMRQSWGNPADNDVRAVGQGEGPADVGEARP
jgi:hypothetical protein|eukprot:COSAG06_NODE_28448_length_574_cov_0.787368_1_plen_80_part_00